MLLQIVLFLHGLAFNDLLHAAVTLLFQKGLILIEVGIASGHKTLPYASEVHAFEAGGVTGVAGLS